MHGVAWPACSSWWHWHDLGSPTRWDLQAAALWAEHGGQIEFRDEASIFPVTYLAVNGPSCARYSLLGTLPLLVQPLLVGRVGNWLYIIYHGYNIPTASLPDRSLLTGQSR